jgi:chemotaxis protein MotB
MTLALEAQRKKAEDTLTLLAAAEAARDNLDINLANAILAQAQAEAELERLKSYSGDLDARLAAALSLQDATEAQLEEARAALAAAESSNQDLTVRLAAAIAARDDASNSLDSVQAALDKALEDGRISEADLQSRLAAALLAKEALEQELAATSAAGDQAEADRQTLEERLAEALLARQALEAKVAALSETQDETAQSRADLEGRLAEALAAIAAAKADATEMMTERERQAALLAQANIELSAEQALSAESQRQVALLNEQVVELRRQIATLQALLDIADQADAEAKVQIESLGAQLNTALARVASEERQRRALEEAERIRLEAEKARLEAQARDLESYKSEFFGQIRTVLAGQEGIRIEGDRFVFSSEVLFETARADLSQEGRAEMAKVAALLRTISDEIPSSIDWIIRVDGHTDNVPLSGGGLYRNNWELSQARALSVVIYMIEQEGIDPRRLSANGFGEYQPINPDDTPDARAQNRRIELKLTER